MTIQRPVVNTPELRTAIHEDAAASAELASIYYGLCDERDATYKRAEAAEQKLAEASARVIAAQAEEAAAAREVEAIWGPDHLARKKEIGQIAQAFGRIPKRK